MSWTYGTFRVAVCMVLWNPGFMVSLDLWIFGFYRYLRTTKIAALCVFASRLVLRIFLESYGTLVAVSLLRSGHGQ